MLQWGCREGLPWSSKPSANNGGNRASCGDPARLLWDKSQHCPKLTHTISQLTKISALEGISIPIFYLIKCKPKGLPHRIVILRAKTVGAYETKTCELGSSNIQYRLISPPQGPSFGSAFLGLYVMWCLPQAMTWTLNQIAVISLLLPSNPGSCNPCLLWFYSCLWFYFSENYLWVLALAFPWLKILFRMHFRLCDQ